MSARGRADEPVRTGAPVVALCGFMAAGKSTVGARLAARLGRRFVDADSVLAARFGGSIAEVFATRGEAAFRAEERALCDELAGERDTVVALGGEAEIDRGVRDAFEQRGTLICLTASSETLRARAEQDGAAQRPLAGRWDELLALRREAYASVLQQVSAEDALEAVTARCEERVRDEEALRERCPRRLVVRSPAGPYPVWLGEGALARTPALLRSIGIAPGPVLLVTQANLAPHEAVVREALTPGGYTVTRCEIPDGEAHKTLATVSLVYDACVRAGIARDRPVIALGGGVVGDVAGFAAATYMRGVPFVQLPTTLLAMVDSSVGGKTGVDLPAGKNLVGAFHHPSAVLADVRALATLAPEEVRAGSAEVLKHALLGDPGLLDALADARFAWSADAVARAVDVKARIVERDPDERGERALLNLGHTFGHAVERVSGYTVRHGEAVAMGLCASAHLARALGLCDAGLVALIERTLDALGLPRSFAGYDAGALVGAMATDKKQAAGRLRFVLPCEPGRALLRPVDEALVRAVLVALGARAG